METKHTKGKWEIDFIAKVMPANIIADNEDEICSFVGCIDNLNERIANAKLIAAAPEMLKFIIDMRDRYALSPHIHKPANDLIKKATQ